MYKDVVKNFLEFKVIVVKASDFCILVELRSSFKVTFDLRNWWLSYITLCWQWVSQFGLNTFVLISKGLPWHLQIYLLCGLRPNSSNLHGAIVRLTHLIVASPYFVAITHSVFQWPVCFAWLLFNRLSMTGAVSTKWPVYFFIRLAFSQLHDLFCWFAFCSCQTGLCLKVRILFCVLL